MATAPILQKAAAVLAVGLALAILAYCAGPIGEFGRINQAHLQAQRAASADQSERRARLLSSAYALGQVSSGSSGYLGVLHQLVEVDLELGNVFEAVNLLESSPLQGTPRGAMGWQMMGNWALGHGEVDLTIHAWERSGFKSANSSATAIVRLARSEASLGHPEAASAVLRFGASRLTADPEYHRQLGDEFETLVGDRVSAVAEYRRVVDLAPESIKDWERLATLLMRGRLWKEAEEAAQAALRLFPGSDTAMSQWALSAIEGRFSPPASVIQRLEQHVAVYPESSLSLATLGSLLLGQGQLVEAERVLSLGLARARVGGESEAWVQGLLADLALRQGDLAKAGQRIDRAIEIAPAEVGYLVQRGDILARSARSAEARAAYLVALEKAETQAQRDTIQRKLAELPRQ